MDTTTHDADAITNDIRNLIQRDQAQVLQAVLNNYPALLDRRDINERTWMHDAAEAGAWSCLEVLKNLGLPLNDVDVLGQTPLQRALTRQRYDATMWLLENGQAQDINHRNSYGVSAVLLASSWNYEILEKMIAMGGNPDATDKHGNGIQEWARQGLQQAINAAQVKSRAQKLK